MVDKSENTKRIAKNTMMLYIRMLFGMLVSLYTSRVVLLALGVEDYGIYNVVGGFVAMFSLISNSLSSSVSRFLTFELGKGNLENLKKVFSTSLLIHMGLAATVFILAESVGLWFLNTQMTIPENRLYAANWVFQASIFSFIFRLCSVPYNASIVSHEKMTAFAYIGMLEIILKLGIVLFISHFSFSFDKLIVYSLLIFVVIVILQVIYIRYCNKNFKECHFRLMLDRTYLRRMCSFAGWNFIGCTAGLLKDHGVNILLNLFMGPVINAARGIAGTINNTIVSFANNFMTALNPQITKSYASNEYQYMFSLVERGARFSFYILLIIVLPFFLETDFILTLWLKQYPSHTVNFVRLILITSLCDVLSSTLISLQTATGKIRNYQIVVGGMLLMNFPLSYFCLKIGAPPESVFIIGFIISVICLFLRLIFLHFMVELSIIHYLKSVCLNIILVTIISLIVPLYLTYEMPYGWIRFISICCCSFASSIISILFLGCSKMERTFIINKIKTLSSKICL